MKGVEPQLADARRDLPGDWMTRWKDPGEGGRVVGAFCDVTEGQRPKPTALTAEAEPHVATRGWCHVLTYCGDSHRVLSAYSVELVVRSQDVCQGDDLP